MTKRNVNNLKNDKPNFLGFADKNNYWSVFGLRVKKPQWLIKKNQWLCVAPNNHIALLRQAHSELNKTSPDEKISHIIASMNDRTLIKRCNYYEPSFTQSKNPTVLRLTSALKSEDNRQYLEFRHTILSTKENNYGYVLKSKNNNSDLADIINIFSHLYKDKKNNPLLSKLLQLASDEFINENGDIAKRLAVTTCLDVIAEQIQHLTRVGRSELDMAFPEEDIKYSTVIRKLKRLFNHLAIYSDYDKRFANKGKIIEEQKLARSRYVGRFIRKKLRRRLLKKELNLEVSHIDELEKDSDGEEIVYQLQDININEYADEAMQKKQRLQKIKILFIILSVLLAVFVAAGQIAVSMIALTGSLAIVVGISSFVTDYCLYQRDIRAFMIDVAKKKLLKGLSPAAVSVLVGYFAFSFATGIVSGCFALDLTLKILGFSMLAAPAGPFIVGLVVATATVVGLTCLFFLVGVHLAQKLKGRFFLDRQVIDQSTGSPVIIEGLISEWKKACINFFKYPRNLKGDIIYSNDILTMQVKLAEEVSESEKQHLQKNIHLAQRAFKIRHVLKCILTVVFIPLAIVLSLIATFSLMKMSWPGTLNLFSLSFKMADAVSKRVTALFTGIASVLNGAVFLKNMVNQARFFAHVVSKFFVMLGYGVVIFFFLLAHKRLSKALKDGWQAFKNNPVKTLYPGIRVAIMIALGVAVGLNGYGNGTESATDGMLPIPTTWGFSGFFVTQISAMLSSMGINLMAIVDVFKHKTPVLELTKPDLTSTYANVNRQMGKVDVSAGQVDDKGTKERPVEPVKKTSHRSSKSVKTKSIFTSPLVGEVVTGRSPEAGEGLSEEFTY